MNNEHKLCWKCREAIEQKWGKNAYFMPYQHCHHEEPAKKPVCKCYISQPVFKFDDHDVVPMKATFCPQCGRKLG